MRARSSRKLRLGLVGAGSIVRQRHLPNLEKIPDLEIVAVSNSTYESSKRFCDQHLPHATPIKNWADLIALPDLDVIWIGTPPHLHATIAISALEANRHVFCQARMSMNLQEAEEMLTAARRSPHLVTMLCPPPHGMRGDLAVRKCLAKGDVGRPHHIRLQSLSNQYLDPEPPAHWRQRKELSGLNVLTLGIYAEVLQRWLGPIRRVFARATTLHPIRDGYPVEIPDQLIVLCEFENGAQGTMEFSGIAALAPPDRLEIYGDHGTLTYNFQTDEIHRAELSDPQLQPVPITPELETPWRVEEDFILAVRSPASLRPRPTFEDGVAYMRVVQAVADSLALRCEIDVLG